MNDLNIFKIFDKIVLLNINYTKNKLDKLINDIYKMESYLMDKDLSNLNNKDIINYNIKSIDYDYNIDLSLLTKINSNNISEVYDDIYNKYKNIDYNDIYKKVIGRTQDKTYFKSVTDFDFSKTFESGASKNVDYKKIIKNRIVSKNLKLEVLNFNKSYTNLIKNIEDDLSKIEKTLHGNDITIFNKILNILYNYIEKMNLFYMKLLQEKCNSALKYLYSIKSNI